jgi:hypothetical protein
MSFIWRLVFRKPNITINPENGFFGGHIQIWMNEPECINQIVYEFVERFFHRILETSFIRMKPVGSVILFQFPEKFHKIVIKVSHRK